MNASVYITHNILISAKHILQDPLLPHLNLEAFDQWLQTPTLQYQPSTPPQSFTEPHLANGTGRHVGQVLSLTAETVKTNHIH